MKIAIPTSDGLTLARRIHEAKAFLVLTLEFGEIIHQEKRLTDEKDPCRMTGFDGIRDCKAILINETMVMKEDLNLQGREIIKTPETIITKAIMRWLGAEFSKEANTCCCP